MKLQIVEYEIKNYLEGNIDYRYMLELDESVVLWTCYKTPIELKVVYDKLINRLLDENIDYDLKHGMKFNIHMNPGLERKVLFEKEVSDTFLKELYVERKLNKIKEMFE